MIRSSLPATIDISEAIETVAPVLGDPGQLHQLVLNLVVNAAQAIGHGMGTMTVALRAAHFQLPLGDGFGARSVCRAHRARQRLRYGRSNDATRLRAVLHH
jgi:nitrogen-specific signal transduction histidine kinase